MSVFSGRSGRGAMRRHRDERYRRAVGRQQLLCDAGEYKRVDWTGIAWFYEPAPAEEFMRAEDRAYRSTDQRIDFRQWARGA